MSENEIEMRYENYELQEDPFDLIKTGSFINYCTENLLTTEPNSKSNDASCNEAPILMTIEIESGKTDKLSVFLDSNPEKLAFIFCKKHNLGYESLGFLKTQIEEIIKSNTNKFSSDNVINRSALKYESVFSFKNEKNEETNENHRKLLRNNEFSPKFVSYNGKNKIMSISKSTTHKNFFVKNNLNLNKKNCRKKNYKEECVLNNAKKSSNKSIVNPGERLYKRGMKLKEETMRKLEKHKENSKKKTADLCTFSPKFISNPSKYAFADLKKRVLTNAFSLNSLNKYILKKEDNISHLRIKYDEDSKECSFIPRINKNSIKIIEEKYIVLNTDINNQKDRHDRNKELFEYSKVRINHLKTIRDDFYSQFSFKPSINNNIVIQSAFDDRQAFFINKVTGFQKKMKEYLGRTYDSETGQNYFSPKVNKRQTSRNFNTDVYQHLYDCGKKLKCDQGKKNLIKHAEIESNSNRVFTSNLTETICINIKKNAFTKLFTYINDFFPLNKRNAKLSNEINRLISPLFLRIKDNFHNLKQETFILECETWFQNLNINQKSLMIKFIKNYKERVTPISDFSNRVRI